VFARHQFMPINGENRKFTYTYQLYLNRILHWATASDINPTFSHGFHSFQWVPSRSQNSANKIILLRFESKSYYIWKIKPDTNWSEITRFWLTFGYLSTGTSSLMTLFTTGVDGTPCVPGQPIGGAWKDAILWRFALSCKKNLVFRSLFYTTNCYNNPNSLPPSFFTVQKEIFT